MCHKWRWVLFINPMGGIVEGFRSLCFQKELDLHALGISFSVAIVLFLCGIAYFRRVERNFADII